MYHLKALEPTVSPLTAVELRTWLRLNHTAEDAKLGELLIAAVEFFEHESRHAITPRTWRQTFTHWPTAIVFGMGNVTSVVELYAANNSTVPFSAYLNTTLAFVAPTGDTPDYRTHDEAPVGYMDFIAGYEAGTLPKDIRLALLALAGHHYQRPEAYTENPIDEAPRGFAAVVAKYRTGLMGAWGQ